MFPKKNDPHLLQRKKQRLITANSYKEICFQRCHPKIYGAWVKEGVCWRGEGDQQQQQEHCCRSRGRRDQVDQAARARRQRVCNPQPDQGVVSLF